MTGSRSQDVGYAVGANGPRRATCERSRSMSTNLRYLGLDVHADTIAVAMAEPSGAVRNLGVIPNRPEAVAKLIRKLRGREQLRACYEAGPCGYVLYWQLTTLGVACDVVAPTLVPTKPGDRVKTDRRDAARLERLEGTLDAAVAAAPAPLRAVIAALQTLRGVRQVTAATIVREVGLLSRFTHPRQLMGYSGTVPAEHSSGARVQRGAITKTGNAAERAGTAAAAA